MTQESCWHLDQGCPALYSAHSGTVCLSKQPLCLHSLFIKAGYAMREVNLTTHAQLHSDWFPSNLILAVPQANLCLPWKGGADCHLEDAPARHGPMDMSSFDG